MDEISRQSEEDEPVDMRSFLSNPGFHVADLADLDMQCGCGRRHRVPIRHIVTGAGALEALPDIASEFAGKNALITADTRTWALAGARVEALLTGAGVNVRAHVFSRRAHYVTDEAAIGELLVALPPDTDVIVAVGSGTMNDIARVVSLRCGVPYMIVGTAPSMDGYASSTSAVIAGGEKISVPLGPPMAIVMDTDLLVTAPEEMLSAGIGDVLGKHVTLADWRLAAREGREHLCGELFALIGAACRRCQAGYRGVLARDPAAVGDMAETLVMAGAAISMFGTSRPCAGSEHQLAHAWEVAALERGQTSLHGNYVGLGTVAAILLYRAAAREFDFDDLGYALPDPDAIADIFTAAGGWALKEKLGVDRELFESAFTHAARTHPRYTLLTFLEERGRLGALAAEVTARMYD